MELVGANPRDKLERPRPRQAIARGLGPEQMERLLATIPESPVGLRDRTIILTLLVTGRRRSEIMAMTADDVSEGTGMDFTRWASLRCAMLGTR